MDRRSLIKGTVVAGVGWSAPKVLYSGRVWASETCTPKCAPIGGLVKGTATAVECTDGPPGQQNVLAVVNNDAIFQGACPCGGDPASEIIYEDGFVEVRPRPGSTDLSEFDISVRLTCFDRQDRPLTSLCEGVAVANIKPGSCQGVKGDTFDWVADLSCGVGSCG